MREITAAADCNLSAINYHFGNKKNLYVEVFRSKWLARAKRVRSAFRDALKAEADPPPVGAVIRAFSSAFVDGPLSEEERLHHFRLMMQEITKPSDAFEIVLEEVIQPFLRELAGLLTPALPANIDREKLFLNILSIFAVTMYFNFAREPVSRITGRKYDKEFKASLIDHIVEFAQHGLGLGPKETVP